jgi:hypothetical protein
MKKLLAIGLMVIMIFTVTACGQNKDDSSSAGSAIATVVIATNPETVHEVDITGEKLEEGLFSVFKKGNIANEEAGGFLSSVGELKQNLETGEYIYIYTSEEKDFDVSEYKKEMQYKGKTLVSSGVGSKDMTVKNGTVIYVTLIKF